RGDGGVGYLAEVGVLLIGLVAAVGAQAQRYYQGLLNFGMIPRRARKRAAPVSAAVCVLVSMRREHENFPVRSAEVKTVPVRFDHSGLLLTWAQLSELEAGDDPPVILLKGLPLRRDHSAGPQRIN